MRCLARRMSYDDGQAHSRIAAIAAAGSETGWQRAVRSETAAALADALLDPAAPKPWQPLRNLILAGLENGCLSDPSNAEALRERRVSSQPGR